MGDDKIEIVSDPERKAPTVLAFRGHLPAQESNPPTALAHTFQGPLSASCPWNCLSPPVPTSLSRTEVPATLSKASLQTQLSGDAVESRPAQAEGAVGSEACCSKARVRASTGLVCLVGR